VGLLERGNGGLVEVQEAVKRYEEPSPLFGFIHYRRRKVLLKYVPEGTSRLLQGTTSMPSHTEVGHDLLIVIQPESQFTCNHSLKSSHPMTLYFPSPN